MISPRICVLLMIAACAAPAAVHSAPAAPPSASDVLEQMRASESKIPPLHLIFKTETKRDKSLGTTEAVTPTTIINPLAINDTFVSQDDCKVDGERVRSSNRQVEPANNALRGLDGWLMVTTWDGKQLMTVTPLDRVSPAVSVNILLKEGESKLIASSLAAATYPLTQVLLRAWNGVSWSDYLKDKEVEVKSTTWHDLPCQQLIWKEPGDAPLTESLTVVPQKAYLSVKLEEHDSTGKIRSRAEVTDIREVEGFFLPTGATREMFRTDPVTKQQAPYTRSVVSGTCEVVKDGFPAETFVIDFNALPAGSRVNNISTRLGFSVGIQVQEDDATALYKNLGQYLAGAKGVETVFTTLPPAKMVALPRDSGPYALLAVCAMRNTPPTLKELSELANTNEQGATSEEGMMKALIAKGFDAKVVQMSRAELKTAKLPLILQLGEGHYAVLFSVQDVGYTILDPPTRLLSLTSEQLERIWTKTAIVLDGRNIGRP